MCDRYSVNALCPVGWRLPFPLFYVVLMLQVLSKAVRMVKSENSLLYRRVGESFVQITHCLAEEGHATLKVGIYRFICCYEQPGTIA